MKKLVRVEAAPGLFVETALVARAGAASSSACCTAHGRRDVRQRRAPGTRCCWSAPAIATAVPLLLFAAAARRIPLSTVGLLQYLTPLMQLAIGVFVYDEPMPPARLAGFAIVWVALAVFTADTLRHARAGSRRPVDGGGPRGSLSGLRRPVVGGRPRRRGTVGTPALRSPRAAPDTRPARSRQEMRRP